MPMLNWIRRRDPQIYTITASGQAAPNSVTAAAAAYESTVGKPLNPTFDSWQKEVWHYYDELGEFRYGIDWRAEMISRVRLRAGKKTSQSDEPEIVDNGPAAELLRSLTDGSAGGPEQLMKSFAIQLGIPGECWLTGETRDANTEIWRVRSSDEIRKSTKPDVKWEVLDDQASMGGTEAWRPMRNEGSFVTRCWEPHPRKFYKADSPARAARPVMRELDLVNRHIQAQYLARLASAGLILIPDEINFPIRPEFQESYDPFGMEWAEMARSAIQNPGSASAAIPVPLRAAAAYLKEIRFVDLTTTLDQTILQKRDSAIRRLATQLDLPAEVLLGMGDVNHWSAWQIEESGVKVHILPLVERICNALLVGYLAPRLKAMGAYDPELVVWYDASEITMRPDRTQQATEAYDRLEISGEAYRREVGFDETDKPDDTALEDQILKFLARQPSAPPEVLEKLIGLEIEPSPAPVVAPVPDGEDDAEPTGQPGPPDTKNEEPDEPTARAAAGMLKDLKTTVDEARKLQAGYRHWLVKDLTGFKISHPAECASLPTACPFHSEIPPAAVPGRSGTYEVDLINGRLRVGAMRQDSAHANQRS